MNSPEISNNTDVTIKETLNLIKQANQIIKKSTHKDAFLVLGNSGVGKTPFTKWITQDNSKLMSVQNEPDDPYLMEDTDNTIGTKTIVSATIFPTLYVNTSIDAAFYDFPGFRDTRGMAYGIATTYATKGIVDKTERIKMIFIVDYDVVKKGGSRDGFIQLLRSISEFVTNIDKFRSSIAIVISKVPKYINDKEASDEQVVKSVAKFITQQVQSVLKNDTIKIGLSDKEKRQAMNFISIILEQKDNDYPKIGLFRFPDKIGPFNNISLVQRGKERVEKIMHKTLNFTTTTKNDFHYTISDESKIDINNIAQQVKNNIISGIVAIGENIKQFFVTKEETTYDIKKLYDEINLKHDKLLKARIQAKNSTFQRCIELVEENALDFNYYTFVDVSSLSTIKSYTHFLEFLQTYNTIGQSNSFELCFNRLEVVIQYLDNSQQWYKFLTNLYEALSSYDIQKNITSCNNAALNFNQSSDNDKKAALKTFLKGCNETIYENENNRIENVRLDESKLKALNNVLDYTLQYTNLACDTPNKLVVKGRYVKFSDITSKNCSEKIDVVEVFASNKVFIDESLNKTGENFKLSIIAPVWHIHDRVQIILDGKPGKAHNLTKASDGIAPGSNGTDGAAGLPGSSAGLFLGIGETFINAQELSISANGGDGSPGQHGGNGKNGANGVQPMVPETYTCEYCIVTMLGMYTAFRSRGHYAKMMEGAKVENYHVPLSDILWEFNKTFQQIDGIRLYGENCTSGGYGGHGGGGGYGGAPGAFFISFVNDVKFPNVSNTTGKMGSDGTGGKDGKAGTHGKMVDMELYYIDIKNILSSENSRVEFKLINSTDFPSCKDGERGATGVIKPTNESKPILFFNFIPIMINDYKNYFYLRENLAKPPVNELLLEDFYNSLENKTHNYYDTSAFVNELYGLEHQFGTLNKNISFSPFYRSLFDRIEEYEKKKGPQSDQVLNYLRAAVLSKIRNLDNNLQDYLVIHVKNYLQITKQDILTYEKGLKQVKINYHKEQFKNMIDGQITRANILITEQILPEIDKIIIQTDNAMRSLVEEMKNLEKKADEYINELRDKQQKLRDQLIIRKVLGFMQLASVFLAFAGPVGAAVGTVGGAMSTTVQTFYLDNTPLPTILGKQATKITELLKNKQQKFKDSVSKAEKELEKFTTENPSLSGDFVTLKRTFKQKSELLEQEIAKGSYLDPESVNMKHTLQTELTTTLDDMKQKQSKQDLKINKKLELLTRLGNIVNVGEVAADMYSKIQKQEAEISQLDEEVKKQQDYIHLLEMYEQDIYNNMLPVIRDITKSSDSPNKSHAELDVSKWKLQSKVKNLNFQIEQMTKVFTTIEGPSGQESVKYYIQQLENAMTTMNQIYHRIQDNQDQLKLATYIADLSSSERAEITNNQQLSNDIDKLRLMIQSNRVMEEYKKGISAFKQYVFPFAYLYIDKFNSSFALQKSVNITDLVNDAANQIKNLHEELEKDETVIKDAYNKYLFPSNQFTNKDSFYTWEYDTYKEDIKKLLQGHAIILKADVARSRDVNVIRFTEIGIGFECANNTIKDQLNTLLTQFKVNMTHLGDSYYRCNEKFYLIDHEKITIIHSVNKNNATYADGNDVHERIISNKPLLSPYATWKIILEHKRNQHETDNDFSSILNYTDQVINLKLEGHGSYLQKGIPIPVADVDKFYKIDDTIGTPYNVGGSISNRKKRQVSSSASSSSKPFGYNVVNWIKTNVSPFKYVTKQIKNWFNGDNFIEQFMVSDFNILENSFELNQQFVNGTRLPEMGHEIEHNLSNRFVDEHKNNVSNLINHDLLAQQGNLLLLEVLLHKKNGMKFNKHNGKLIDNYYENLEYAQNLAYSAYV